MVKPIVAVANPQINKSCVSPIDPQDVINQNQSYLQFQIFLFTLDTNSRDIFLTLITSGI